MKHSHYHKDVSHLKTIDVYRVLQLFDVTDQAIGHAIKKLLCAGQRGTKTEDQDVQEAIDTLTRRQAMLAEDWLIQPPDKPWYPDNRPGWTEAADFKYPTNPLAQVETLTETERREKKYSNQVFNADDLDIEDPTCVAYIVVRP